MTRCHELEMLREVKDVNRVQVDNYHLATLATIKHRSDMIESADDNDEIEWTEDPYECKSQPATAGSPLFYFIQIQGPHGLRILSYFDTAVRAELVDLQIDETKWKSNNKHRLPPRTHSVEIRQQCDQLLELG